MTALILLRGGGDLASGVAVRLYRAGLNIAITELPQPLAVRRTVSFSEAIYERETVIEGIIARAVDDPTDTLKILNILAKRQIPVLVDPECTSVRNLNPLAIVDARMTKHRPERLSHHSVARPGPGPWSSGPCAIAMQRSKHSAAIRLGERFRRGLLLTILPSPKATLA